MTFSLLALDRTTGSIGCAAATGNLAVGESAAAVVDALTRADSGRDYRQLAVLDARGSASAWTGCHNEDEKGQIIAADHVIVGNWLCTETVLTDMNRTYGNCASLVGQDFGVCLLQALQAAVEAGGDARGTLSAAIRIVRPDRPPIDLRVDYDEEPLLRLRMLYEMATNPPYSDWTQQVPTLDDPNRC